MVKDGMKVRSDTKKGVMESMKKVVGPGFVVPNDSKDNEVAYMMGHCSLEETLEKDFSVAMGRREEGSRSLRNITSLGIYIYITGDAFNSSEHAEGPYLRRAVSNASKTPTTPNLEKPRL